MYAVGRHRANKSVQKLHEILELAEWSSTGSPPTDTVEKVGRGRKSEYLLLSCNTQ
jgi:hypothetical protein